MRRSHIVDSGVCSTHRAVVNKTDTTITGNLFERKHLNLTIKPVKVDIIAPSEF